MRKTVIGKHALVLAARGEKEMASQIFVYDFIREIRLDTDNFEVKLLMNYDESYHRVFVAKPLTNDENGKKEAFKIVSKFYNDLLNAAIKLTPEEFENLKKQDEEFKKQAKNAAKK